MKTKERRRLRWLERHQVGSGGRKITVKIENDAEVGHM